MKPTTTAPPPPEASPNAAFKAIYTELLTLQDTVQKLQARIEALEANHVPRH